MSLDSFTHKLHFEFVIKDLGSHNYFLGLEATPISYGLFPNQLKYVHDILSQAQMLDNKFIATHMVVSQYLSTMVFYFLFSLYIGLSLVLFNISLSCNQISLMFLTLSVNFYMLLLLTIFKLSNSFFVMLKALFILTSVFSVLAHLQLSLSTLMLTGLIVLTLIVQLSGNLVSWSAKK
jgi:hypothetical protein